jgi:DNA-binding response OmpR family regulator
MQSTLAGPAENAAPLQTSAAPSSPPGAPGGGQRPGSGTYPAAGAARRRVLIVEDDEPTRRLLAITLRRTYDVVVAADGVEGLELAGTAPFPELVITDVMMPRLDGLSMVREIKKRDPSRKVPIIFLTAKGGAADVAAGISAGARHYLPKPVKLSVLEDMVKSILRRS